MSGNHRSMSFSVNRVLPHSWCKLSPPKTCKQLKLCEIERFCTESHESASPGPIAQSNRLRISNLVTFSTHQPAPKVRKNQIKDKFLLEVPQYTNEGKTTAAYQRRKDAGYYNDAFRARSNSWHHAKLLLM